MKETLRTMLEGIKYKIDENTPTKEDTLKMLAEADLIDVITDENGDTFTDLNGNIIVF